MKKVLLFSVAAACVAPLFAGGDAAVRMASGLMPTDDFLAFLQGAAQTSGLESHSVVVILLLVLVGGLAANLTPCVLPLVPVNLALVGRGWRRGLAYGAGIALSYGALGAAAAFGGLAFGTIQSSPWFNIVAAVIFILLALAMADVFFIDFAKYRSRAGGKGPFLLGVWSAVLAGACVEPILIATLAYAAKGVAEGRLWAAGLPFVLGCGMGLPWPFVASGIAVLPKPGAWMVWVKRAFSLVLFGMAVWYAILAVRGFRAPSAAGQDASASASATGRPTLVVLGAPWCKNCKAMKATVFKEARVIEALKGFEVREIEINRMGDLKRYPELAGLDIKGVPTYVILPPAPAAP